MVTWSKAMREQKLSEYKEELEFLEGKLETLAKEDLETRYNPAVNKPIVKDRALVIERIRTLKDLIELNTQILEGRHPSIEKPE